MKQFPLIKNISYRRLSAYRVRQTRGSAQALLTGAVLAVALLAGRGQGVAAGPQPATQPTSDAAPNHDSPRGPTVYRLTVHPRPEPDPALKYELLPELQDKTQGNAATAWLFAFQQLSNVPASYFKAPSGQPDPQGEDVELLYQDLPLEQFLARKPEVEKFLGGLGGVFRSADVAARREQCDWGLPLREQGFDMALPHLNPARKLANLLAIRARYQVATGDWDGAAHSMQSGFSLACDLNHEGVLIQNLVGIGIGTRFMNVEREWQQQPDAPNLYWALAGLPKPFSDFRSAMQLERATLVATFPQLRKTHQGGPSENDWQEYQDQVSHYLSQYGAQNTSNLPPIALSVYLYPRAKKYMLDHGVDPAKLDAMPTRQVLAVYEFGEYQHWSDELLKWTGLPFWQAWDGFVRTEDAFSHAEAKANPLLNFLPAVRRAYVSGAVIDRRIAAAQTIEAVRAYVAVHAGAVPVQLQALVDMPAPPDPVTGRPFDYRVEQSSTDGEARITMDCPAPPGAMPTDASRYEVAFLKH
jgi:hypothetical protein